MASGSVFRPGRMGLRESMAYRNFTIEDEYGKPAGAGGFDLVLLRSGKRMPGAGAGKPVGGLPD